MKDTVTLWISAGEDARVKVFLLPKGEEAFSPETIEIWEGEPFFKFSLEKGRYLVSTERSGYYSVDRCVELEGDIRISIPKLARECRGFEPREERHVFVHEKEAWDAMSPDEDTRWEPYSVIYDTPYFRKTGREVGAYRITTQNELLDFLGEQEKKNPWLTLLSLGKTGIYDLEIPLAVFSKDLSAPITSVEEAGAILQRGSKPVVFYQAQIHGNEPASGEAALGMIAYLSTPEGMALLDRIHIVIMPRMNPEGALLFQRSNGQGLDLNRDYLAVRARETKASLRVFHAFLPSLVLDGHEFLGRKGIKERVFRDEDIQLSGGCAPNADPELMNSSLSLLDSSIKELARMGLRSFFYHGHFSGSGMATAIRYFAELGAPTVLIESRGIDMGTERFRRRVMGHFTVARTCMEAVAKNPEYFLENSRRERARFEDPFDREFVLEGKYTDNPETDASYPVAFFDTETGELQKKADKSVPVFRVPVRTRPRPQSYLIPLGETWEQLLISLLERHRIRYELRDQGTELSLRAFEKAETGYRLAEAREVAFPNGALEIPVAQPMSHIVSFLFEMDSADSVEAKKMIRMDALFFPKTDCCVYRRERA